MILGFYLTFYRTFNLAFHLAVIELTYILPGRLGFYQRPIWHSICHSILHAIWHFIQHSIWHQACVLTLLWCRSTWHSAIPRLHLAPDNLSSILSDISLTLGIFDVYVWVLSVHCVCSIPIPTHTHTYGFISFLMVYLLPCVPTKTWSSW